MSSWAVSSTGLSRFAVPDGGTLQVVTPLPPTVVRLCYIVKYNQFYMYNISEH